MADEGLVHLARREYVINCNWKVFCDNYLVRVPLAVCLLTRTEQACCVLLASARLPLNAASTAHQSAHALARPLLLPLARTPHHRTAYNHQPPPTKQDGGYHVAYAHPDLAAGLDLGGYSSELHEVLSVQRCKASGSSDGSEACDSSSRSSSAEGVSAAAAPLRRLSGGRDAAYAFVYPNLMLNRYGCAGLVCMCVVLACVCSDDSAVRATA